MGHNDMARPFSSLYSVPVLNLVMRDDVGRASTGRAAMESNRKGKQIPAVGLSEGYHFGRVGASDFSNMLRTGIMTSASEAMEL
jgi:hypothetical protein